jgi:hypothetical protein
MYDSYGVIVAFFKWDNFRGERPYQINLEYSTVRAVLKTYLYFN